MLLRLPADSGPAFFLGSVSCLLRISILGGVSGWAAQHTSHTCERHIVSTEPFGLDDTGDQVEG